MNNYIRPETWREFEARWPAAAAFLLHANLLGEREDLRAELQNGNLYPGRKQWITNRLTELDNLFADQPNN